jgi:hypothetical protein
MNTATTTRFAALAIALVMTVAVNGTTLFMFDAVAKSSQTAATVVALDTVTITAKRI